MREGFGGVRLQTEIELLSEVLIEVGANRGLVVAGVVDESIVGELALADPTVAGNASEGRAFA